MFPFLLHCWRLFRKKKEDIFVQLVPVLPHLIHQDNDLAQNLCIWKCNILLSGTQINVATTRLSPILHLSLDLHILRFQFSICRRNYLFIFRGECEEMVEILLCMSLSEWSQLTVGATSSCLTSTMLHQRFNLTFYIWHETGGTYEIVCPRKHTAIRWWCSLGFDPWLCKMKQNLSLKICHKTNEE